MAVSYRNRCNITMIFAIKKLFTMKIATTKERILQFIEYKCISQGIFFKETGIKRGFLDGDKLNAAVSDIFAAKIIATYPDLDLEWLISGNGNMLKKPLTEQSDHPDAISLYDVSASAGFGNFEEMISQEKVVGKYLVPDFRNVDWMIYVKGSSMYPKYSSGDIIACRVLHESRFIQWGKVYVLATKEQGILVKRIEESEKENCLKAVSDNPAYKPFNVPKDEIVGIALVVGVIRME